VVVEDVALFGVEAEDGGVPVDGGAQGGQPAVTAGLTTVIADTLAALSR